MLLGGPTKLKRIPLDSYPAELALTRDGQVLLGSLRPARLECRNLNGALVWQHGLRSYRHSYGVPFTLRVDRHDKVWVCEGAELVGIDTRGNLIRRIQIELLQHEHIGTFALVDGGFVVAAYRSDGVELTPRLLRLDSGGTVLWERQLTTGPVAYRGIIEVQFPSGESRPVPPWRPKTWQPNPRAPLLVGCDLVVAGYTDMPASGIGVRYGLSLETGEVLWTTSSGPFHEAAVAGSDRMLIGLQGYGAFETQLYERTGHVCSWRTHGQYVVDGAGDIRVIEQDNSKRSGCLVRLRDEGHIVRGDEIPGYYTSRPVLADDGRIAFWREDTLYSADDHLAVKRLCRAEGFASELVLTEGGLLVFPLVSRDEKRSTELCLFQSDLRPPAAT